jgi:hypothetical protein
MESRGPVYLCCPHCSHRVRRGSAAWDEAIKYGRCPECRKFYEAAREAKVAEILSDPGLASEVQRKRMLLGVRAVVGSTLVGGFLVIAFVVFHHIIVFLPGSGMLLWTLGPLSVALRLNPEREARLRLEAPMSRKAAEALLDPPGSAFSI